MKKLLLFLSGAVAGIAAITFYQMMGKPVTPTDPSLAETQPVRVWDTTETAVANSGNWSLHKIKELYKDTDRDYDDGGYDV